jgi:hypothetical protein
MKRLVVFFGLLGFLFSYFYAFDFNFEIKAAIAKPPPWAPAHGYRRKHEDYTKEVRDDGYKISDVILVAFNRLDANRDGVISLREWDGSESLFIRLDLNRDGVLNRSEYSRVDEERGLLSNLWNKTKERLRAFVDWLF